MLTTAATPIVIRTTADNAPISAPADECDAPRDWDAGTILFDPYV